MISLAIHPLTTLIRYVYIYCHPQTDCFIVSQLFSVARHAMLALLDTRVLNSFEELCIMRVAAINSFARVLSPCEGAYILSSTDKLYCITTLQCSKACRTLEAGIKHGWIFSPHISAHILCWHFSFFSSLMIKLLYMYNSSIYLLSLILWTRFLGIIALILFLRSYLCCKSHPRSVSSWSN